MPSQPPFSSKPSLTIKRRIDTPPEKVFEAWTERESLVTVLLGADGGGTLLTLIHEQFFDEAARDRHEHGWNGSMDKLERLARDL